MTRTQGLYHRPTDSLIKRSDAIFYPLHIQPPHAQLRNFISTVDQDWLYYASGHDIYTLHLPTQRTSLLITTPFAARCLAAGLGWICVGGESNGDCAFIRLKEQDDGDSLHVDARLPINLPEASEGTFQDNGVDRRAIPRVLNPDAEFNFQPDLLVQELGGEIVNSITIHDLSNAGLSDRNEPIALLSNNDKTVKIYSLARRKVVEELPHPFPMNYALVSSDSNVLAAVGDGSRAFFYRRRLSKRPGAVHSSTTTGSDRFPNYEWQLFAIPKLPVGDRIDDDHSFAISFSQSGHFCAISSQGGMISVFDMDVLNCVSDEEENDGAFLCTFKSSRSSRCGYVRSLEFSPGPWDLLAWSEDHGRVGVADVRQAFCRRQILQLDPGQANKIELEDITPANIKNMDIETRLVHQYRARMQSEYMRPPSQAEYSFLRNHPQVGSRPYHAGLDLDARERSVLDTLELTMDEIYEASHSRQHPYSLNYTSSPRVRASLDGERPSHSAQAENQDTEERERERVASIGRSYLPRRRNSVVLSRQGAANLAPRATSRTRITASPSRLSQAEDAATDDDQPPLLSTNDLTPTVGGSQTQPLPYNIPPSDPWHVIQNALESARASDNNPLPASSTTLARLESALVTERRLSLSALSRNMSPPSAVSSAQVSGQTPALPMIRPIDPEVRRYMDEALQQARDTLHIDRRAAVRSAVGEGARDIERHQRILEARAQARQRVAAANAVVNGGRSSRTEQRSELGRASAADVRLARMMLSGNRHATDQNGNWVAGEALERLVAARGGGPDADGLGGSAVRELVREMGPGTAGVGWSPDGRHLFAGTTQGVFQYSINLADRKTFPAFGFR